MGLTHEVVLHDGREKPEVMPSAFSFGTMCTMSRLRSSHLKLARSYKFSNNQLHKYQTPQEALDRYIPWLEERRKLVVKSTKNHRLSKATTTYYKEIRLGNGWPDKTDEQKAYLLVRETVHVKHWDHYKRLGFAARYIFNARFRWAIEVHCCREGIMWGVVVLKARGHSDARVREILEAKIDSSIRSLLGKTYALGSIRKSDIKKHTRKILREGIEYQLKRVA